jgi:DNA-binding beta-propeller fold protein YncE
VRSLILLLLIGCSAKEKPPTPGCDPGTPGLAQATQRPLAVVGDRVSDKMELYSVDPFAAVGCVGLDENPSFIDEPFDLAQHDDSLYVVLGHAHGYTQGTLVKFHLPDGARVAELTVGEEPSLLALTADGKRAYVSLFRNLQMLQGPWTAASAVVEVDTEKMQIVSTVEICNAALGIQLDEANSRLWVACAGSDAIAIVNTNPLALDRVIPLEDGTNQGRQAAYVLLDGKHAFVTAQASDDLWIFDQNDLSLTKRIAFESGTFPQRMAMVQSVVLVALDYVSALGAIDANQLVIEDRVPLGGAHPQGIAVSGRYALVTNESNLKNPGQLLRVDLMGLGAGGAHLDENAPAAVFPQAVIVIP